MWFRLRLWTRLKLALRRRPLPSPPLPFEVDEFAKLLSSRDPAVLKQLAVGLARPAEGRPDRLKA